MDPISVANTARETAYLAARQAHTFLEDTLADLTDKREQRLAHQIAYGTCRMQRALDDYALKLNEQKPIKLKRKERVLLQQALYQIVFLDRVPLHAVVNDSVQLAKKYCFDRFAKFLNALLRKCESMPYEPSKNLAISTSHPDWFVEKLIAQEGKDKAKEILEKNNTPPLLMGRNRSTDEVQLLDSIPDSSEWYIQNKTPVLLMTWLKESLTKTPETILDLCAAPGGKTLLLHDWFPKATITANDPSDSRIKRLQENLTKYGITPLVTQIKGETYPTDKTFDLVVVDLPCSNSGVLNKRPEARWRLNEDQIKQLQGLQKKIIERAKLCVAPGGSLWILTCSILDYEHAPVSKGMQSLTVLPTGDGGDGGFAAHTTFQKG